ncbi:MAG TPA: hypothetical protein VGS12_02540 [Caulobacteraceae bacterium]|nr:hypothetical protein [Caulobacteraceae bacterium]
MFWRTLLTGQDNASYAIGRVLGSLLFLAALLTLPAIIAGVLLFQRVSPTTWFAFMAALEVYVPAMILAIGGLIRGTAATEPTPQPQP